MRIWRCGSQGQQRGDCRSLGRNSRACPLRPLVRPIFRDRIPGLGSCMETAWQACLKPGGSRVRRPLKTEVLHRSRWWTQRRPWRLRPLGWERCSCRRRSVYKTRVFNRLVPHLFRAACRSAMSGCCRIQTRSNDVGWSVSKPGSGILRGSRNRLCDATVP